MDGSRTTTYTYDAWARLKTAVSGQFNLGWDYDRFGNRKNQNANPGPQMLLTINPNTNRVTQIGSVATEHDAAGNLTKSDLNRYVYDAENRLTALKDPSGLNTLATYTYDGAGLRLKKVAGGTTTRYIFSGTKVIAEYDNDALPTAPTREYIYAGSQLVATLSNTGAPAYHHPDHLSVRVNTDTSGTVVGQQGHYPFGESWYSINSTTKWQFTSYERDSESSLDYAMFRYDSSRLGRFMTPDLLAGTILDPQSLNRYAYVRNAPVNVIDPLGLTHEPGHSPGPPSPGCTQYCYWHNGEFQGCHSECGAGGAGGMQDFIEGLAMLMDLLSFMGGPTIDPSEFGVPGIPPPPMAPPPCEGLFGDARVTSGFGAQESFRDKPHKGVDFGLASGTPVQSPFFTTGTVEFAGPRGTFGNLVVVQYPQGTYFFAHLSSISPSIYPDAPVNPGQGVGRSGDTGRTTGPNLHLERHGAGGQLLPPCL